MIQVFERTNDLTPSRKRPKKRERTQPEPDTEEEEEEDDDETTVGDRLENSTSNRTYDSYKSKKEDPSHTSSGTNSTAIPSIKVNSHSNKQQQQQQSYETTKNKSSHQQQHNSNGSTSIDVRIKSESGQQSIKKSLSSSQQSYRVGSTSSSILNDDLIDTNSSSSDDQPLSHSSTGSNKKRCKGFLSTVTKRKAEVLSKESGKIGVTIKTSPEGPPPNKLLCTNVSATPITVPIKTEPAPLSPETPASHPESNTPPEKPSTSSTTTTTITIKHDAPIESQLDAFKSINSNNNREPVHSNRVENQQTLDSVNSSKIANDFKIVKRVPQIPTSPKPAPPRLWLPKCNASDHVIITDVTVNKETVTIRECKKEAGFFQPRHEAFTSSSSPSSSS